MITLRTADGVAELVLDAVEARNAINRDWVNALAAAVGDLADSSDVRALLIRAEGPAFSVGGDLAHFNLHLDELADELDLMVTSFHTSLLTIAQLPLPVVCAAQGAVAGGGLGLLWASDVVLVADNAKLTTAFAKLGLSGDGGSSWYLPRMVGERKALSLMLNATVLSALEATDLGLADAVVPAADLTSVARARAAELAGGPTLALGTIRRLVRESAHRTLAEGLDAELAASRRLGSSADARAGILAFAANQKPDFNGR
jgi:2-(1,2-epoxy-1,2-dihydrophenyl)acetyl-CoA isomerase